MAEVEHTADRPSWVCRACDGPWPCKTARTRLLDEMNEVELAIYCWANLEEAIGDLHPIDAKEAFDRFLNWSRPRGHDNP
jgi:hypothetical protein